MLDLLDGLGISDDTIVMYSIDNGPHMNSWPDAGLIHSRTERASNYEGAYRVPCMVRWSGQITNGSLLTGIVNHLDWLPTILVAAGEPEIKQTCLEGYQIGNKTFNMHLDGDNMLDY